MIPDSPETQARQNAAAAARRKLRRWCQRRVVEAGEMLFREGDAPEGILFVMTGSAELRSQAIFATHPEGCRVTSGEVVGLSSAISGRPWEYSAVAHERCVVDFVPRTDLQMAILETAGLHLEVVRLLSYDIGRCYDTLRSMDALRRRRLPANEARA